MGGSDDREYWRRQDDLRDERRREYNREDDRRVDFERKDRADEIRVRDENHRRAMEEMRRGNTAWALNLTVGPDAAINYLEAMQRSTSDGSSPDEESTVDEPTADASWPPHTFVTTRDQLLENIETAPFATRFEASRIDDDGDAVVNAVAAFSFPGLPEGTGLLLGIAANPDRGTFWVKQELLASIASVAGTLGRAAELARKLEQLSSGAADGT